MNISEKTFLVTGGAVRIGRSICEALGEHGAGVVVHYRRSRDEAEALCEELRKGGSTAWALQADLSSEQECRTLIEKAAACTGELNGLINNAGVFGRDNIRDFDLEDAKGQFNANLFGPMVLINAFVSCRGAQKIVNLLDRRVSGHDYAHLSYVLSKKALADLTIMAALDLAPHIAVNAVAPGAILPPPGKDEAYLKEKAGPVPLERQCTPREVAQAVLFLLRNDTLTGQILFVDGGQHLLDFQTTD